MDRPDERKARNMKENVIYLLVYLIASIVLGVLVHLQMYGIAAGLGLFILIDVINGLQKEEDGRWS